MSVVDPAFQFPADWASCSFSIGVIRDGDTLRFWFQPLKGEGQAHQVSVEEWQRRDSDLYAAFHQHVEDGALVSAGVTPDRGLVRECTSPLKNLDKSAEIWPSLLDTALPFPLEHCEVAFLPPEVKPGGNATCLAAAALRSDIQQACSEWFELNIHPDLLIPEVLLLSGERVSSVWMGESRCVYTAWHEGHFLGSGGCIGQPPEAKAFSRFQTVWRTEVPDHQWKHKGPGAADEPMLLEKNAAQAVFLKKSCFVNLLANHEQGPLIRKLKSKRKGLLLLTAALLFVLVTLPVFITFSLHRADRLLQEEIALEYFKITGEESSQPGQEVLLATRYLEESMKQVFDARSDVSGPHVSRRLQRVLIELAATEAIATAVEADSDSVVLEVLAKEDALLTVQERLQAMGERVQLFPAEQGAWRLEVTAL